jgi:hypothetical protein
MDDIPLKNDPSKELTLENYPIEDIEDIKQVWLGIEHYQL